MTGPEEEELAELRGVQAQMHEHALAAARQAHTVAQVMQAFLGEFDLAVHGMATAIERGRQALDDFYAKNPELK